MLNTVIVWGLSTIGPYHGRIPKQPWDLSLTLHPESQWDHLASYKIGTGGSHLDCAVNLSPLPYAKIQNIWTLSFTTPTPIQMEKAGFIFSILTILQYPGDHKTMYFQFCIWTCQFSVCALQLAWNGSVWLACSGRLHPQWNRRAEAALHRALNGHHNVLRAAVRTTTVQQQDLGHVQPCTNCILIPHDKPNASLHSHQRTWGSLCMSQHLNSHWNNKVTELVATNWVCCLFM